MASDLEHAFVRLWVTVALVTWLSTWKAWEFIDDIRRFMEDVRTIPIRRAASCCSPRDTAHCRCAFHVVRDYPTSAQERADKSQVPDNPQDQH